MSLWWRLVRFGFRLLYNEFAFTYDAVSWVVSLGEWRCWVRAALAPLDDQQPILDLAHGTGNLQADLLSAGRWVVGYDLSPAMGRIAGYKLRQHGLTPRLVRGRAQVLPFAAGTFGAVISTFPTDFIVAQETLQEVYRVLKPGGLFIVVPNARLTGGGTTAKVIDWLYQITGQRTSAAPESQVAALFAPFEVETREEPCPRSVVSVIVARKTL